MEGQPIQVLVVTDETQIADRVDEVIRREGRSGASARHVGNPEELDRKLSGPAPSGGPVVLLDLQADGYGLDQVERVSETLGAPTVALTDPGDPDEAEAALARGAQDALERDEDRPAVVLRALRYARERQALRNEVREQASHLETTLQSITEGVLVVDLEGNVELYNERFRSIWGLSDELVASMDDERLLEEAMTKLEDPDAFREGVEELYENPAESSYALLEFADGRVVERYSRPREMDGEIVGRVWTFRDVTERERTEEALRESEERFRSLYENATIGLYRTTPEGEIVLANPTLLDMLGCDSFQELADHDLEEGTYHPLHSREDWRRRVEAEGEIRGFESTWETADGEEIRVRESARAVRGEDGEVHFYEGTLEDVTDRWQVEEELERRNELLTALHDVSLQILGQLDLDDVLKEIVERASDLVETDLGWIFLREEGDDGDHLSLGYTTSPLDEHQGLELERGRGHAGEIWDRGEPFVLDDYDSWDHRAEDFPEGMVGAMAGVPITHRDELVGVLGVASPEPGDGFRDEEVRALDRLGALAAVALENARLVDDMEAEIRDRREAQEALRRSQERLRDAQRVAQVGSWDWDVAEDRVRWSDEQIRILGLEPGEVEDPGYQDFLDRVHPDDLDRVVEHFFEAIETGSFSTFEFRVVQPDGALRWAEIRGEVDVEDGEVDRMRGTILDITDRVVPLREYEALVESSHDAIVQANEAGEIVGWNEAAEDLFGYAQEEIVGEPLTRIMPERFREAHEASFERFVETGEGDIVGETAEFAARRADGSEFPVELSLDTYTVGDQVFFSAIMRDISDRKEAQERLRESEERYRTLVDAAPDAIYNVALDGTIESVNPAFEDITGWPPEEWEGRSFEELIHPDDLETAWEKLQEIAEGEERVEAELRFRTREGETVHAHLVGAPRVVDGEIEGLIGIGRDVTERKERERRLAESQGRLQEAQEVGEIGDWSWDLESDKVEVSDELANLFGIDPDEEALPIDELRDRIHPEDVDEVEEHFRGAASDGEPYEVDHRVVLPDGSVRWLQSRGEVETDEDGEVIRLWGTCQDITDFKESRRALAERTRRLETLVSNVPGVVYRCRNVEGWPMSQVEGECRELTGYPADAIEEGDVSWGEDLIHPEDRARVQREVQEAVEADEAFELEYRIRREDGEVRWMWERGRAIDRPQDGDEVLEGFITDITDRKEAEEQLQRSEARYRRLVEAAPDVIYTMDEEGVIQSLNPAFEDITGWAPEEWEGEHFSGLVVEEDMEKAMDSYQDLTEGKDVDTEIRFRTTSGEVVGEVVGTALGDVDGGRRFLGVVRDITDRKEAEERLRRSEARYRRLVEAAPDPIFTLGPDGSFRSVNSAWEEATGWTPDQLEQKALVDLVHPEDEYRALQAFDRVLDGERAEVEFRVRTRSGGFLWGHGVGVPLYEDGEVDKVLGVIRDITERKEAEDRLRTVKNFNQTVLEHAPVGIAHVAEDGSITYQNRKLRRLRGVDRKGTDPLREVPIGDFDPVVERPEFRDRIQALLDEGEPFTEFQGSFEDAEGEELHMAVTGVPIEAEGGDVDGAILLARDVTEEKELEREVERQTVQLIHSEKMAALGHLVAGIAHEINNPLSALQSNTELMEESAQRIKDTPVIDRTLRGDPVDLDEIMDEVVGNDDIDFLYNEGPEILQRNLRSLQRIADFIDSLRTFATPDPDREPEDLNAVLSDTVELFLAQYREEVDLRTSWGEGPPVPCDESQVGQVVMNLLLNAAEASPEGGRVDLRTRRGEGEAVIEVEDRGFGIPGEDQDRIFDPFYSTKEDDSMGLGLSISENIVADHGGSIDVESSVGEGTLFRVRLPLEEGKP